MAAPIEDNQAAVMEKALTRFIDDYLQDKHPDIEEFIAQYPECEVPLKERIQDLREIFTLFDSLVHVDDSDFEETIQMQDLVGRKIANFEVEKTIGRGGMGVVYLARDSKLNRLVAIKSMPVELQTDSTARMRLKREAQLLASLNHPNIGAIYEIIEREDGVGYLILEYIPGETLTERITRKSLKVEEVLSICEQVAGGVSAAHQKGVVHRDLKPGNIKITPEGKVKVLDFGLAKAPKIEDKEDQASVTEPGHVIGTPAYMSPEQARGQMADHCSDIWAFGCILYEMLSGQAPFKGATVTDTLANILNREPDWQALTDIVPTNILILLRRCLEKDPFKRLQHIGDARIEISETLAGTAGLGTAAEVAIGRIRRNKWQFRIPWFLLSLMAVIAAILTTIVIKNMSTSTTDSKSAGEFVRRFPVILPSSQELIVDIWASNVALAPDGTSFVYVAGQQDQKQLYLYDMANAFAPEPINGTEGAYNPFFSYDSESIAFFAEGKLKKLSLRSGTVLEICKAGVGSQCGSWGPDDTIFFVMVPAPGWGLYKVSSKGGSPELVTSPDSTMRETYYWFPHVLPGGKAVLFNIVTQDKSEEWCIAVLSLNTGTWRDLNLRGSNARYIETGHIVYAGSGGRLLAAPFDIERLMVTGSPNTVIDGVVTHPAAQFCASRNGTLIYAPIDVETVKKKTLVWFNPREAKETPLGLPAAEYDSLRISPDGRWLAVQIGTVASNTEVHVCETTRLVLSKLTFNPSWDVRPRWSPISNKITYASMRNDSSPTIFWVLPDGSDEEQLIDPDPESFQIPSSWSADEQYLAFVKAGDTTQFDIWVLSMEGGRESRPFVNGPYNEKKPVFHPNGGWLAYVSDETGRFEVYVRQFPSGREKTLISTDGGNDPMWDPSGRTLYYRSGEKMMAIVIETEPYFTATQPKELFEGRYEMNEWGTSYDVVDTPDGLRFLMIKPGQEGSMVTQLNVVLNWSEELKRLAPMD